MPPSLRHLPRPCSPYSLKDSLLNPTVEKALIFHDIYLDRWGGVEWGVVGGFSGP
jgi:hypothetical protein